MTTMVYGHLVEKQMSKQTMPSSDALKIIVLTVLIIFGGIVCVELLILIANSMH